MLRTTEGHVLHKLSHGAWICWLQEHVSVMSGQLISPGHLFDARPCHDFEVQSEPVYLDLSEDREFEGRTTLLLYQAVEIAHELKSLLAQLLGLVLRNARTQCLSWRLTHRRPRHMLMAVRFEAEKACLRFELRELSGIPLHGVMRAMLSKAHRDLVSKSHCLPLTGQSRQARQCL